MAIDILRHAWRDGWEPVVPSALRISDEHLIELSRDIKNALQDKNCRGIYERIVSFDSISVDELVAALKLAKLHIPRGLAQLYMQHANILIARSTRAVSGNAVAFSGAMVKSSHCCKRRLSKIGR